MRISGDKLNFSYEKNSILKDIDIEIEEGKITSITGPNGVGKSTLIKCISNIYNLESGIIYLNEDKLLDKKSEELAKILGYVPQQEKNNFDITAYEMILLGRRPYIKWKVNQRDKEVVNNLLEELNIGHLAKRNVHSLSGGEKQKVAIARALAQEPEIILLDEPTASLDLNHQVEVMKILKRLAHKNNKCVVVVLHDLNLASRFSDKVFLMDENGFYKVGTPEEVFTTENIRQIYNIEVEILESSQGSHIVPLANEAI